MVGTCGTSFARLSPPRPHRQVQQVQLWQDPVVLQLTVKTGAYFAITASLGLV